MLQLLAARTLLDCSCLSSLCAAVAAFKAAGTRAGTPPCALLVVVQSCHPSPFFSPLPPVLTSRLVSVLSCHAVPAHLTGTSPLSYQQCWSSRMSSVVLTANLTAILAAIRLSPPVLVSSVPAAILTVQHLHLKPVTEGDHQNRVAAARPELRAWALQRGWGAAGHMGAAAMRATVRAPGTAAARLSSSLPPPRWTFRRNHFSGNILVATFCLVVPPCRRRVVVLVVASSSSPRRRPRRRCRVVVLVASSSSPCHRRRRRRVVVASCRRRVVSSVPASILTPGPHHQCWSSHCRVFASIPRLSSPPGPHHQCWSSRSRVIRPRLYPHRYPHRNPHRYPRPRPSPPHLPVPSYLKPVREGGCSDCEDLARCSEAGGLQRSELQLL